MKFCSRCDKAMRDNAALKGRLINATMETYAYMCQVPLYDHLSSGALTVRVWDCRINRELTLTPKQYEAWKQEYYHQLDQENSQ